jgi:hypothetical protein
LTDIFKFLTTLEAPSFETTSKCRKFVKWTTQFFIQKGKMYKHLQDRPPLLVVFDPEKWISILLQAHEDLGHKGVQSTFETICHRFFWPHLYTDVKHHIQLCHDCQICTVKKMHIPITISTPATIFTKIYIDILKMPAGSSLKHLVLAWDDLSRWRHEDWLRCAQSISRCEINNIASEAVCWVSLCLGHYAWDRHVRP